MTNGEISGTDGDLRTVTRRAVAIYTAVLAVVAIINTMSLIHEGAGERWWEPWVWEWSSALVVVSILWLPWLTWRAAPIEAWRRPRTWLIHLGGVLAWSGLHVAGFLVLRHAAYALAGVRYDYGDLRVQVPYELGKDLFSYAVAVATFHIADRYAMRREIVTTAGLPVTFDIRDGARLIRVPVADILAVASAGNYVEFHLADGRKPLMRVSLASVEGQLADKGFVRVHRSWLVNAARVTGLRPEGSGDWTVELGALEAPLSRRFPEALAKLKG
ncbi:LytTR family DNA-binding domain-containing protein [Caulobacter mirabilis]|uniref:LytTR family DNA-binding domain-containing protein n=1 Tax=Caulobacter mirabilis TaxID=69666 RepID=UPI001FEC6AB5|nr:LytTR family DNA-binding domain-containing protein [Caulobacter mirabilis]